MYLQLHKSTNLVSISRWIREDFKKQVLNPQKGVSGTDSFKLWVWQSDYSTQLWVWQSDYSIHLWVWQSDYSTNLQSDYSTEFSVGQSEYTWVGFGSQTTVLNFGLGSRTIAVTSQRSESSNTSLVILDNILYYSRNLSF